MKNNLYFMFTFIALICFLQNILGEQKENTEPDTILIEEKPDENIPVIISKFKIIPKYYGLPLSFKFGWFYRKDNVSIFPNTSIFFSTGYIH